MSQEMTQAVQNIVDAVTAETDVITSGEKLLTDLFTQLEAVIQEVKDDPANVAKLDDLVATVNAKKEELAAAIVANTPAAPPPAPAA